MKAMIIDANALGHVVKHATKDLSFRGDRTGVVYGFIKKLMVIQANVNADFFIFCWDAGRDSLYRKEIFHDYKIQVGEKTPEEIELDKIARPQFIELRKKVLPKIGFSNNLIAKGLEADDIIAQIVLQYKQMYEFTIVSRDNDLHQLLEEDRVAIFDPVKMGYFTERIFTEKWGVPPKKWELVKSIAGCSGDGVPGVERVKEKTAIKFLKGELKPTTQAYKKIVAAEELCVRNMRLVKLPWESTPSFDLFEDSITRQGFIDVAIEYGFRSLRGEDKVNEFIELFGRAG